MDKQLRQSSKKIVEKYRSFKRDEKGLSNVIVMALLIVIGILGVAALSSIMTQTTGGIEQLPRVHFDVKDHPDVVTNTNSDAFIIRHLGGDRVNYNDLMLAVYASNGSKIYSKIITDAQTSYDVSLEQVSGGAYDNNFFEGSEQIVANSTVVGHSAGTYTVTVYYKPSMTVLCEKDIMVS